MAATTKQLIIEAYMKLVETNPFDKITVTDIVELCAISRQTFYYHFGDIETMLQWLFSTEADVICEAIKNEDLSKNSIKCYTDFVSKYDVLIKKSLNTSKFILVHDLLFDTFYKTTNTYWIKRFKIYNNSYKSVVEFWASAILGLVIKEAEKEDSNYEQLFVMIESYIPKSNN